MDRVISMALPDESKDSLDKSQTIKVVILSGAKNLSDLRSSPKLVGCQRPNSGTCGFLHKSNCAKGAQSPGRLGPGKSPQALLALRISSALLS
jgi:hypothetical protein